MWQGKDKLKENNWHDGDGQKRDKPTTDQQTMSQHPVSQYAPLCTMWVRRVRKLREQEAVSPKKRAKFGKLYIL